MSEKRMSGDHRRLCILKAVRSLFSKKGLKVTSKELSQAAGVSEALIYKHFHSKEGLYKALLEISCHAHDSLGQSLAEMEPSTEVLACATYLIMHIKINGFQSSDAELALSPSEIRGLLLQSYQTDGEFARTLFSQGLGPWVKEFVSSMEASIKAGELTPPPGHDLETLVWFSHHAAIGVAISLHPQPDAFMAYSQSSDELIDSLHTFTLRGMGVHQEAINRVFKTNLFKKFKETLQNQSKENSK